MMPHEPAPSRKVDSSKHYTSLDGLRGIAILAVFFYHYARGAASHSDSTVVHAVATIFGFGWTGVDLFFVLSGFLITGILYDTLGDSHYFGRFYGRRILRIFPIYYLFVLVLVGLAPYLGVHWKAAHLLFLLYLGWPTALIWPALVDSLPHVAITHLWSLSLEEQFYMVWPWVIAKLRNARGILIVCVIIAASAIALRVAICITGWPGRTWTYTFLPCRADTIAIGAAISILLRGPARQRLLAHAPIVFFLAAISSVGICFLRRTVSHDDTLIATLGFTLFAVTYGALLVSALTPHSWFERILSLSVLRTFGKYSYGFYLYHFPLTTVLGPMKEFFIARMHSYVVGATVHLGFNLLVNLIVAMASFHFIEAPILRFKRYFEYDRSEGKRRKLAHDLDIAATVHR